MFVGSLERALINSQTSGRYKSSFWNGVHIQGTHPLTSRGRKYHVDIAQNKVWYVHYATKRRLITSDNKKKSILSHSILYLWGSISTCGHSIKVMREIFPESFLLISGMACIGSIYYLFEPGNTVMLTMLTWATRNAHKRYRLHEPDPLCTYGPLTFPASSSHCSSFSYIAAEQKRGQASQWLPHHGLHTRKGLGIKSHMHPTSKTGHSCKVFLP